MLSEAKHSGIYKAKECRDSSLPSVPQSEMPASSNSNVPERADEIHGSDQRWYSIRRLALRRLDRMMSLEPKVLRGHDPDAIHDFRVASRRLQQVLDLLFPTPKSAEIRRLRRRIRKCRRLFSDVRNCDVLIAHAGRQLRAARPVRRDAWEAFAAYLRVRREKEHARALRRLSHLNLAEVYVHLRKSFALDQQEPDSDKAEAQAASHSSPHERLSDEMQRVWQAFAARCEQAEGEKGGAAIHACRIAAKRLRYLSEVVDKAGVKGAREPLEWLRKVQDLLGGWHDLEIAEQMMAEMIARPVFLREHPDLAAGVLKLMDRNRRAKEQGLRKFPGVGLDSPGGRRFKEWAERVSAK